MRAHLALMIFSQSLGFGSIPEAPRCLSIIIQRGSRCVQAVQLSSGPCETDSDGGNPSCSLFVFNIIDCATGVSLAAMYRDLMPLPLPGSHGEANRGAETAAGEAMPDQQGAAEAEQRPG